MAGAFDCSFPATTLVATPGGPREIADLAIGDRVWAYDEQQGAVGIYPVTAQLVHIDTQLATVTFDDRPIVTTPDHPFYVAWGWSAAGELQFDDAVVQQDGGISRVERVTVVELPQTMYNTTVQDAHTYFVGDKHWLVHDACSFTFQPLAGFSGDVVTKGYHMNFTEGRIRGKIGLRATEENGRILISVEELQNQRNRQFTQRELRNLDAFLRNNPDQAAKRADIVVERLGPDSRWHQESALLQRAFRGDVEWEIVR